MENKLEVINEQHRSLSKDLLFEQGELRKENFIETKLKFERHRSEEEAN